LTMFTSTTSASESKKSKSYKTGCAPVMRPDAHGDLFQSVAKHEEIVHGLRESKTEGAAPALVQKQRETVVSSHLMRARKQKESSKGGEQSGLGERYPRRWYDSFMPFQMPFEDRETVKEVIDRLEKEGNEAAWRTERHARAMDISAIKAGGLSFALVILMLMALPLLERLRMAGEMSSSCFQSDDPRCEVLPYPRLALWCALAIVVAFKLCSVDMSRGPFGALPQIFVPAFGRTASQDFVQQEGKHAIPRTITGAVPESEREGVFGCLERVCAVWHGLLGSFLCGVLLLLGFSKHMSDSDVLVSLSGDQIQEGAVVLARAGLLDNEDVDLSRCLAVPQEDVVLVAAEFFGMRNLALFMCGAVLFGIGELFKLRSVQDYPAKGLFSWVSLLRISRPWIWNREVLKLKQEADIIANELRAKADAAKQSALERPPSHMPSHSVGETLPMLEYELPQVVTASDLKRIEDFGCDTCEMVTTLMNGKLGWYNIGQENLWRVAWAAAFQLAGVALWVPASLAELEPCLHVTNRWSVAGVLVSDAVDQSEMISFGSMCVMLASLCLMIYLQLIPYELHVHSHANPDNWLFQIKFLQDLYKGFNPLPWLRLVVDGVLLVYVCDALLFGQLGSSFFSVNPSSGWAKENWKFPLKDIPFNPWALWRGQVLLYAIELSMRFVGSAYITGKYRVMPSQAEEAVYAVEVQDMLLELLHQVADAAGPIPDVQLDKVLGKASADLQVQVYEEYQHALERREYWQQSRELLNEDPHYDEEDGRLAAQQRDRVLQEFIVDNRWLKAQTDGLSYRHSKSMEDHDVSRPVAPWYSVVFGYDEEDGWVQLEDGSFLPSFVNEVPVLTIPEEEDPAAAQA